MKNAYFESKFDMSCKNFIVEYPRKGKHLVHATNNGILLPRRGRGEGYITNRTLILGQMGN